MFLPKLNESWNRDIKLVIAIVLLNAVNLVLGDQPPAFLEVFDGRFGFSVENVGQGRKGLTVLVVKETALLEQKRKGLLSINNVVNQRTNLSRASVRVRDNLDELCGVQRPGPGGGEQRFNVDVPFRH